MRTWTRQHRQPAAPDTPEVTAPPDKRAAKRRGRAATRLAGTVACALFGAAFGAVAGAVAGATPAHAEAYASWGFHQWNDDGWTASMKGAADVTPTDGDVEGWRFGVFEETPKPPRADGDFEAICGEAEHSADQKRVAVVIDFGHKKEAPGSSEPSQPRGQCAVVAENASSAEVLATVADVREDGGLVCAVDTYPGSGCGDPVADVPDLPSPEPTVDLQLPGNGGGEADEETATAEGEQAADEQDGAGQGADQAADQGGDGGNGATIGIVLAVVVALAIAGGAFVRSRRRQD